MQDSTAKLPSGIFNGNLNQYGDYDMCLNVVAGMKEFQGKYCVAYIQPRSKNGTFSDLLKLIQSNEFFKSNFNDVRMVLFTHWLFNHVVQFFIYTNNLFFFFLFIHEWSLMMMWCTVGNVKRWRVKDNRNVNYKFIFFSFGFLY